MVKKHKMLYETLVKTLCTPELRIPPESWARAQMKGLNNRLKDLNWLVLHRKLPVRSTLHAHNLSLNKHCPREQCFLEETIHHVLWECNFASSVWALLKQRFECLKTLDYDTIVYFNLKTLQKIQDFVFTTLISLTKAKLWNARQSLIKQSCKWTKHGVVKCIELDIIRVCLLEVQRWGWDTIKDRWKIIFPEPPKLP